jgi:hypothetical protein
MSGMDARQIFRGSTWLLQPAVASSQALARGRAQILAGPLDSYVIHVDSGTLWLTRTGDRVDHVLGPGESLRLSRRVRVVVEAMDDALFRLTG